MRNRELNRDQNLIGGQMAVQNWTELNGDQRLNCFGATQFTAELGSNSDLTRVQSWTTLVQCALSLFSVKVHFHAANVTWLYQIGWVAWWLHGWLVMLLLLCVCLSAAHCCMQWLHESDAATAQSRCARQLCRQRWLATYTLRYLLGTGLSIHLSHSYNFCF